MKTIYFTCLGLLLMSILSSCDAQILPIDNLPLVGNLFSSLFDQLPLVGSHGGGLQNQNQNQQASLPGITESFQVPLQQLAQLLMAALGSSHAQQIRPEQPTQPQYQMASNSPQMPQSQMASNSPQMLQLLQLQQQLSQLGGFLMAQRAAKARAVDAAVSEKRLRDQQLRDQQLRDQQLRDQQLRDQQLRDQQLRDQQLRDQQLRDQQERVRKLLEEQLEDSRKDQQNEGESGGISGKPNMLAIFKDPEIMALFQDPGVVAAFKDIGSSLVDFAKRLNNAKVVSVIHKLAGKLGSAPGLPV